MHPIFNDALMCFDLVISDEPKFFKVDFGKTHIIRQYIQTRLKWRQARPNNTIYIKQFDDVTERSQTTFSEKG